MDLLLRLITIVLLATYRGYYFFMAKKADQEKPKTRTLSLQGHIVRIFMVGLGILLGLQLIGLLTLFPIKEHAMLLQQIGVFVCFLGLCISIVARRTLGPNWVAAAEYQIKDRQALITSGIYSYIRHPIYLGLILMFVGGEMVAKSYLFLSSILLFLWGYDQGKREEALLLDRFGKAYKAYMLRTKMFIPFVL